jgi:hypothetical protein
MVISGLFNDFNFSSLTLSFACADTTADSSGYEYSQYVTFDNVFNPKYKNSVYASKQYLSNFRGAFKGYSGGTVKFNNLNLINTVETENYMNIGGNIWQETATFNMRSSNSNIDEWIIPQEHES